MSRWLRLVAIRTAGPGDSILLEDANDLGEWASTPPAVLRDGQVAFLPPVPPLALWTAPPREPGTAAATDLASMGGAVGQALGL